MIKKKFHLKIKDEPKKAPRKKSKVWRNVGHALTVIGTTVSSMLLILVIMLCIIATVIVVYILDFKNSNSFDIDLKTAETKFTSMVYATDKDGQIVELKRLADEQNRIWVNYEDISKNIIYAVVAKEDKRFYTHKGVDWQRTVYSLVNDVLRPSDGARQGGSTITQQLIKNITGDSEQTYERKFREIFRALSLEERYTKEDILQYYLNEIPFGGMLYGVEAACQYYFGKSAKDVTIAEAAVIAGIIQNPTERAPYRNLELCREGQLTTLYALYTQGYIGLQEYEAAKAEQVKFIPVVYGDYFGYTDPRSIAPEEPADPEEEEPKEENLQEIAYKWNGTYEVSQNWYTDAAIRQVINDYADLMGITTKSAKTKLYNGGFKIYTNMDMEKQEILEAKYRDPRTAVYYWDDYEDPEHLIQSAFIIMDYTGTVVAMAGGLGEKPGDNCFDRVTMALRSPGSTMKPISPYSMGIQTNLITYSTLVPDKGIPLAGHDRPWPDNFEGLGSQTNQLFTAWYAVRWSRNTVPVRLTTQLTPQVLYNHLTQNLGFTTLVEEDNNIAPVTLGALSNGVKLIELAGAYQVFGNGGIHYEPKLYNRVLDSKNNVILEQDFYGNQAIDSDTAWVLNRMMKTVITAPGWSNLGPYAKLPNVEVIGKTGTSNDGKNLLFVGETPQYVGIVWMGRDDATDISKVSSYEKKWHSQIWHDVMIDIVDTSQKSDFVADPNVLERRYCTESGLLASADCTSTDIGYYRPSNVPQFCSGKHDEEQQKIRDFWDAVDAELAAKIPKN